MYLQNDQCEVTISVCVKSVFNNSSNASITVWCPNAFSFLIYLMQTPNFHGILRQVHNPVYIHVGKNEKKTSIYGESTLGK